MKVIWTIVFSLLLATPFVLLEEPVSATDIVVDGDISDWEGIPPLMTDSVNDNLPDIIAARGFYNPIHPDDIEEIYMTNSSEKIFLLIKVNRSDNINEIGEDAFAPLLIYIDSDIDGEVDYSIPICNNIQPPLPDTPIGLYGYNLHYPNSLNFSLNSCYLCWNESITTYVFNVSMYQDYVRYNHGEVEGDSIVEVYGNDSYIEVALPKLWNPNNIAININSISLRHGYKTSSPEIPPDNIVFEIPNYWLDERCPDSGFTMGEVHSPIDVHIYDDEGNHVGNNYLTGELEEEISGLIFNTDEDGYIKSFFSYNGNIVDTVELFGTGDGSFVFESAVTTYSSSSDFIYSMVIGDCVSTGQIIEYDYPIHTLEGHPNKIHYRNNSQGQWIPYPWKTTIDFNLVNVLSEPITTMNYVNIVSHDWEYYDHSFLVEHSNGKTYEIYNVKSTYSDFNNEWIFDFSDAYIQKNSQKNIQLNGIQPDQELIIKMKYQLPTLLQEDISEIIEDNICINKAFSVEFKAYTETAIKYIEGTDTNTIEYQFMN